jgi:carboxyl-terminal processing protease
VHTRPTLASVVLIGSITALLVSITGPGGLPAAAAQRSNGYEWIDPIIQVRRHLLDDFHETPDEEAMQRAMINAMVNALDDPYTVYVPPAREAEFTKLMHGRYVGIGAEVDIIDDVLTIVSPLDDSPALEGGIQAGDIVLAIEGEPTFGRTIDECIEGLLGEPGTPVLIRVRHADGAEEDLTIERRHITTPTVKGVSRIGETWDYWLDEPARIAGARISQFNHKTAADLRRALDGLQEAGLRGLVVDLRGNPGGELSVAVEVADLFLAEGAIVSIRGRSQPSKSWHATPADTLSGFPMVVLLNSHSASASEIVAGALQENGRAEVLGTRSYGKGSVQEVYELPYDHGTLKLTSAQYYLPSGRNISPRSESDVWGVDPDEGFVVPMSDETFVEVILARRRFEAIRSATQREPADFADAKWITDELGDTQLAAAVTALQVRLKTGQWPVVGDADSTQLALGQRIRSHDRLRQRLLEELDRVEKRIGDLSERVEAPPRPPLLPPAADLADGTLAVRDRNGNLVAAYRLLEGDLESALRQVKLTPIDANDVPR